MFKDYYKILELEPSASEESIKKSYRRLAGLYHPDKNPGRADVEKKFKEINEAYAILSNFDKKSVYDTQFKRQSVAHAQMWEEILKPFSRQSKEASARIDDIEIPGEDLDVYVEISFLDSYHGVRKTIDLPCIDLCGNCSGTGANPGTHIIDCGSCGGTGTVNSPFQLSNKKCVVCNGKGRKPLLSCEKCKGHGKAKSTKKYNVAIPAGVRNGSILKMTGKGNPGNPPGDLFIHLTVKELSNAKREGDDLVFKANVPWHLFVLGGEIEIDNPLGNKHKIQLLPNTPANYVYSITGAGFRGDSGLGDCKAELCPVFPRRTNARVKKLIEEIVDETSQWPI